jgi:hypothetical protein
MTNLTDEQKQRIEHEEQSRLAEEAYRQEVRRNLASPAPPTNPPSQVSDESHSSPSLNSLPKWLVPAGILALVVAVIAGAALLSQRSELSDKDKEKPVLDAASTKAPAAVAEPEPPLPAPRPPPPPEPVWVPVVKELHSEGSSFTVSAHQIYAQRFAVPEGVRNFRLVGHFSVSGGANDIDAVVISEDEYANWSNGHLARAYWNRNKTTTGSFDLRLAPGPYVIAFSNKMSVVTSKNVFAVVSMQYEELKPTE